MKNSKKTISIILAIMMILSSFPIISLAAETPTVTEWPTVTTESVEVGMLYSDIQFTGGSASVPGTFIIHPTYATRAFTTPTAEGGAGSIVRFRFVPDDTETYSYVNIKSADAPRIFVKPASNPVLNGELTAKTILAGAALSTSELALGTDATVTAGGATLTTRIDTITFDNPDKVYTELGTYEEPVTIKFKLLNGVAYSVDLKTTVKVKISDKLDSEIITAPTLTGGVTESSTAKDLTVTGGEANVEGRFVISNPDQKLVVGENTINVIFIPTDTAHYNPTTVDVTVTLKGKAPLPEKIVIPWTFNHSFKFSNVSCDGPSAGINIEGAQLSVRSGNNSSEFLSTRPMPGEHEATALLYFTGDAANMYEREVVDVIIKVTPEKQKKSTHYLNTTTKLQNDGSYLIEIGAYCYYPEYMQGNVIFKVNGEKIGEEKIQTSRNMTKYQFVAKKTGDYVITAEYVPTADDCYLFEDTSLLTVTKTHSFEITMPREVKATGRCDISSIYPVTEEGLALPGATVKVRRDPIETHEKFDGWTFYDDEGNEFVPEGLAEDYMTREDITFIMPNHDVKVKATVSLNLSGGDDEGTGDGTGDGDSTGGGIELPSIEIPDIDLGEIEFDANGTHKYDLVNMIQNLIAKLKAFIYEIGAFFGAIDAEDVGGAIEGIVAQ